MTVCQQPTSDYDIQRQSPSFMPSLPQPIISFLEAATLLASTVPPDKGTNLVPRPFWLFEQSPQKCKETLGRDCLTARTSSRLSLFTLVGVCQPFSGCSREWVGGIEFDCGTVFPKQRLIFTQFSVPSGDR